MEYFRAHRSIRFLNCPRIERGFSLIELLVVLGIIGVITVTVITSQNSFNKSITLVNTAYDIALTLRSAQTYGLGSRAAGGVVNTPYGLHFDTSNNKSFILFADTSPGGGNVTGANCAATDVGTPNCQPGDYVYTSGVDAAPIQTYAIGNGLYIQDFCAYALGAWTCKSGGSLTSLDIAFGRPDPDPNISKNGSYAAPPNQATQACIVLAASNAPSGPYRYIKVVQSGEITASGTVCP